ncbi:Crp/Fnr family transcriptional regulator [Euzebya sp.]|uniref:Crp/Fnr family transcriptional regulator n=1 Tax=Euzebya sp. TaxID=1971409 RepID=UPI003512806C
MARTDLSPLTGADVVALENACTPQRVEAGTVLLNAGAPPTAVHIVREGRVHLAMRNPPVGRQTIGIVGAGGVVGDVPLLTQQDMPFDAYADVDSTLLTLGRDQFLTLLSDSASLSLRWTTSMAQRIQESQRRLVTLLTKDLASQIATVLMDHRVRQDGAWIVPMPHQTIAHLLGARRQSVSRVLGHLRRDGLVRSRYGSVEILDLPRIAELAGDDTDGGDLAASA